MPFTTSTTRRGPRPGADGCAPASASLAACDSSHGSHPPARSKGPRASGAYGALAAVTAHGLSGVGAAECTGRGECLRWLSSCDGLPLLSWTLRKICLRSGLSSSSSTSRFCRAVTHLSAVSHVKVAPVLLALTSCSHLRPVPLALTTCSAYEPDRAAARAAEPVLLTRRWRTSTQRRPTDGSISHQTDRRGKKLTHDGWEGDRSAAMRFKCPSVQPAKPTEAWTAVHTGGWLPRPCGRTAWRRSRGTCEYSALPVPSRYL